MDVKPGGGAADSGALRHDSAQVLDSGEQNGSKLAALRAETPVAEVERACYRRGGSMVCLPRKLATQACQRPN
jgi:hypothetical protein